MRMSNLNITKINTNNIDSAYSGQNILMNAGELYQFESGIYGYGNIWTKLEENVMNIIRNELDKAGCIEVMFPKLQPKEVWDRSGRWNLYTRDNDIMYTLTNNFGEYGLAPTAEECATLFGANRLKSYKNMPCVFYQIGEKFRKEIRARGYLFRPRTFTMMDAYSFDKDSKGMEETYNLMHDVYLKIFEKLGLNVVPTISDNGTMGGKVSEEFQVFTELGEDTILYDSKNNIGLNKDILDLPDKDEFIKQLGIESYDKLEEHKSIECGNNFQLGTRYSDSMNLQYVDKDGSFKPYYMGCYGLGVGRLMACLIENNVILKNNKVMGFALPYDVAPYKVQIIYTMENKNEAFKLYNLLQENGIKAIIDDRDEMNIGAKIKDVSVIGTPKMIIIGNKFDNENYIIEDMLTGSTMTVSCENIVDALSKQPSKVLK